MEREQQELLQKIAAAGTASGKYHRKAGAQNGAEDRRRLFTGGLCVCDEHFMAKSAGMIIIALLALLFHYGLPMSIIICSSQDSPADIPAPVHRYTRLPVSEELI